MTVVKQLSPIELRALHLAAEGKTNLETSASLGHPGTGCGRLAVRRASVKLGALNRAHLVALAYQAGLLAVAS